MSISYRKSIKAGPFKINLSKSGIGLSTGVKGLRTGINSKGKSYISGGTNGIRYRKQLDKNSGCSVIILIIIGAIAILKWLI